MTAIALPPAARVRETSREASLRYVVSFALVLAGAAHAVAVADHRDSVAATAFFAGAVVLQLGSAFALLYKPSHRLRLLITGTTTLLLGIWVASRTVGIAVGHAHGPEAVAVLDGVAVAAQVIALVALAAASGRGRGRQLGLAVVVSVAIAGTVLLAASRPAVDHHGADHSTSSPAVSPQEAPSSSPPQADAPAPDHGHGTCHEPGCETHAHP